MVPTHSEPVTDKDNVKIQLDVYIQLDHVLEHRVRRPVIVVVDKENNRALLIDIAMPRDTRVDKKEQQKVNKYQDLTWEIKRLWKVEARVLPIVIGALGTIPRGLEENVKMGITTEVELIQKVVLYIRTARKLRKVLEYG